jgi:hypothetical protein
VYDALGAAAPIAHLEVGNVLTGTVSGLASAHGYWVAVAAKNSVNPIYGAESARQAFSTTGVTANAGPDRLNITRPSTITLVGTGTIANGVTYQWTQLADEQGIGILNNGDKVTMTGAATLTPQITIPTYALGQTVGPKFFRLTVSGGGATASDVVKVVPVVDPIGITSARWKATDFRIIGTGGIDGATITVYRADNNAVIGTATVTLGAWEVRLRNGVGNPFNVFAISNRGGRTGSVPVT